MKTDIKIYIARRKREQELSSSLNEIREQYQKLQGDHEQLNKEFALIEKQLEESEKKCKRLERENKYYQEELADSRNNEAIEKYRSKTTYSFLYSEGYIFDYKANVWRKKEHDTDN